nr:T9SS type A sorting domain-containing protein [Pontibacter oryzae]
MSSQVLLNTAGSTLLRVIPTSWPSDPDGTIVGFKFTSVPMAAQGILKLNNTVVEANIVYAVSNVYYLFFDPAEANLADVVFDYTVVDNSGEEDPTPARAVIPINSEPVANNVTNTTSISSSAAKTQLVALSGADRDPEGSITHFQIKQLPTAQQGTLYIGVDKAVTNTSYAWANAGNLYFDPAYGNEANVSFAFTVIDNENAADGTPATFTVPIKLDFDLDGIEDKDDLDDDNDGIPDDLEGTDDKDQDNFENLKDLDSDGDGISDVLEAHKGIAPASYDHALARLTSPVGTNGLPNSVETSDDTGLLNYTLPDTDSDGVEDFLDSDSDNDGVPDTIEAQDLGAITTKSGADADNDGLDDSFDADCGCSSEGTPIAPLDTESDGIPDYLDADSDNDGTPDEHEAHDANNSGSSIDDLKLLGEGFRTRAVGGSLDYYPAENESTTWLNDAERNGITDYLQFGTGYYYDTDMDGLVDLFDADNYGEVVSINASFRDPGVKTPLPVTLVRFAAHKQSDAVILSWATASERENDYFVVERSLDGRAFAEIGSVQGAGNSNNLLKYTFLDMQAPTGNIYYRLKQVDFSGTFEYSKVASVKISNMFEARLGVYPVPAKNLLHLDLNTLPEGNYAVRILNMQGQHMRELVLSGMAVHTIRLNKLAAGKYIIQVQGEQLHQTESFIKQ